ncbi:hypothetical protein [Streptomyces lydicus]|uniref:hypothetical protein n=1 Tax=Streptomyces lydicus TaxID=47763 RepID=UPI003675EA35
MRESCWPYMLRTTAAPACAAAIATSASSVLAYELITPSRLSSHPALYRINDAQDALGNDTSAVQIVELAAATRQAYAALWRFLAVSTWCRGLSTRPPWTSRCRTC